MQERREDNQGGRGGPGPGAPWGGLTPPPPGDGVDCGCRSQCWAVVLAVRRSSGFLNPKPLISAGTSLTVISPGNRPHSNSQSLSV